VQLLQNIFHPAIPRLFPLPTWDNPIILRCARQRRLLFVSGRVEQSVRCVCVCVSVFVR